MLALNLLKKEYEVSKLQQRLGKEVTLLLIYRNRMTEMMKTNVCTKTKLNALCAGPSLSRVGGNELDVF